MNPISKFYYRNRWRMFWLIDKLTDGRPMEYHGYHFTDIVTGRPVYRWRDLRGRWWAAEHSWSLFRVELHGYA